MGPAYAMISAMPRSHINPPELFDSLQYGFSQAVVTDGQRRIDVSGQVGWDSDENLVGTDLATQVNKAADSLRIVLEAAGASLADVTALRIYVVEAAAADLSPITAMLQRHFPREAPPATTWLVISRLADEGLLVELEATAVVD